MPDAATVDIDDEFDELDSSVLAAVDAIEEQHGFVPADRAEHIDDAFGQAIVDDLDNIDAEVHDSAPPPPPKLPPAKKSTPTQHKQTTLQLSSTPDSQPAGPVHTTSSKQTTLQLSSTPDSQPAGPVHTAPGMMLLAPGTHSKEWDNSAFFKGKERPLEPPAPVTPKIDHEAARTWVYPVNKPLRNYQLNIVKKALFHNVLVALPTGLGKTFIAAVVILNMFRWFPHGKIIFVAPTRPLVAQQQQACHAICGLPWDTAIELTGSTQRRIRDDEWKAKRIFYMTPQTFENDLTSSACDPREVTCVVVDEAHRATGNYAYCTVMRNLMYHNPAFRILALTATPGSTAARVQEVVDNLHIDMIELRTEDALDIQPYIHRKSEEIVSVTLGDRLEELRGAWAALMRVYLKPLQEAGILTNGDPHTVRPFSVRSAGRDPTAIPILRRKPYLRTNISQLATMAFAMQFLTEHSVRVFAERAREFCTGNETNKGKVFSLENPAYAKLISLIEGVEADALEHPKIRTLRRILHEHFNAQAMRDAHCDNPQGTRAMVFCSFREVVNELVDTLRSSGLTAMQFIGQATDSKGNRGLTQRKQEQIVNEFRQGQIQVLVATSIGEEGLDIGEVDLIVCYEAVRDSVRSLQRIGRTGRNRDGRIIVLATPREEHNWKHSKESYQQVQRLIRAANTIELYTDVSRILPPDVKPELLLTEVDQPPFDPTMLRAPRRAKKENARKPRVQKKLPVLFCSAGDLRRELASQREGGAPTTESPSKSLLIDDSDDEELSTDSVLVPRSSGKQKENPSSEPFPWSSTPANAADAAPAVAPTSRLSSMHPPSSPPSHFEKYKPHPLIAAIEEARPQRQKTQPSVLDTPLSARDMHRPRRNKRQRTSALFSTEAERDTSSEEHGESDEDDDGPSSDEANDEDRAAVGDFAPTQAPGYNQQAIYMQSMLSQGAPSPFRRNDRLAALLQHRAAARPSSEPSVSADEYSEDSFVVGDDEIVWENSESSTPAL